MRVVVLGVLLVGVASCVREDARVVFHGGTGAIVERGTWAGELRDGPWEAFYPDGQPKEFGRYERGVRTGPWTSWHPGGVLRWEGRFDTLGRRFGRWTEWHVGGQRSLAGVYVDGLRDGTWIHWDESGLPFAEQSWQRGTWVSTRAVQ